MRQALPLLKDRLDKNENSQTVDFLNRVTGKVDRRSDVLGKVTNKNLCVDEIKAVQEAGFSIENHIVPVFPRYRQDGVTYSEASTTLEITPFVNFIDQYVVKKNSLGLFKSFA